MAITRSTRARVLCPSGRRHTLTTHLACLRLTSSTAPGAAIRNHQPGHCGYLRPPATVRNPAAGRWRRAREASYLLFYASPCLKLKLALVVLNVLRALPQSEAIRNHQPLSEILVPQLLSEDQKQRPTARELQVEPYFSSDVVVDEWGRVDVGQRASTKSCHHELLDADADALGVPTRQSSLRWMCTYACSVTA